jgi:hypothetical protein
VHVVPRTTSRAGAAARYQTFAGMFGGYDSFQRGYIRSFLYFVSQNRGPGMLCATVAKN